MRRSRFFLNSFLRLVAAAGLPPAAGLPSGAPGFAGLASGAVFCCSFATMDSVPFFQAARRRKSFLPILCKLLQIAAAIKLTLFAQNLLFRSNRSAPRTLAGASVGVRALAAHRQVTAMPDATVRLNFNEPANVHLNLFAQIAFHAAFFFNFLAQMIGFVLGQIANLFLGIDACFFRQLARARLPDSINGGQADIEALLHWKIHTCDTCHAVSPKGKLSLALLVLRIVANHPHHSAPVNHLALVTNL